MPDKFNELLLKQDIIELYNAGITPDYGYLMNGRFEKDMVKTLYPLKMLSGNPISWEASDTEYLFPIVSLEPKQSGTGDPSPENVRPISGWDSVQVTRCGKNLLDPLYTTRYTSDIYWGKDSTGIRVVKGKTYTLSNDKNLTCAGIYIRSKATDEAIFFNYNKASLTFTPSDTENVYFQLYSANVFEDAVELMLELGSAPTDYEPYQGNTYDMALPETVYGGSVDAVTGVGSKTWGYIASYNGESLPGEWISDRDVYSAGATPTTGAQVAYQLATPEPFQATGNQPLTSLLGYNTIYTNGDSITLNRKARRLEV